MIIIKKKIAQHSGLFFFFLSSTKLTGLLFTYRVSLSRCTIRQGVSFLLMCSLLDCSSLALAGDCEIKWNCKELFFWGLRWYRWIGVGSRLAKVKSCHNFGLECVYSAFLLDIYLKCRILISEIWFIDSGPKREFFRTAIEGILPETRLIWRAVSWILFTLTVFSWVE